jgi:DNA (cytosine-5)-methyltransferase 1
MIVRRLSPVECARLQGFSDDHAAWGIDESGKRVEMSDSFQYRSYGNAVTVEVVHWIACRMKKELDAGDLFAGAEDLF